MKRIVLKLISEHTNVGEEPSVTETKLHKEYDYLSNRINNEVLNELFDSIRTIREDWIAFKVTADDHNIYADITFLSMSEGKDDLSIPGRIIKLVDQFFKPEELTNLFLTNEDEDDDESEGKEVEENTEETEGLLIQITEHSSEKELEFIKALKKKNIDFDIITHNFLSTDVGAASLVVGTIFYISNAMLSGVIYSIAEEKILSTSLNSIKPVDFQKITMANIKKIRKDTAQLTSNKVRNLILDSFDGEKKIFTFKTVDATITVECDSQYVIKNVNTKKENTFKRLV